MAAGGPGITDIKLLFARSGNRCAFPKCRAPMALNETLTGEVCHIKGTRPGSARHDPNQTDLERHAYSNLILMCPTHHTVIDDDEEAYTVERLNKIKAVHEAQSDDISDGEASAVAAQFIQSTVTIGQSGGLSAHTVNASTITLQSAPPTTHLTHQRQIQAVEHLWQVVRDLGSEFGLLLLADDVITTQELEAYFRAGEHARIGDFVREYADEHAALQKIANSGANHAEKERPFVTHRLWSVFLVIRAMYGRTAHLIAKSYKERRFASSRADRGCDQHLRAILPVHLVDHAKGLEIGGLRAVFDYLESQFLAEAGMNKPVR